MTTLELTAPAVSRQHEVTLLREMLRIRRFEEKCVELYSLGKIHGFLHLYIGEEAVAVGAMQALTPEDRIVSTYREHGHALARGVPMDQLMAEMYGKANGCSRGVAAQCICSTSRVAFMAGTQLSAVDYQSLWD
jgi:TPP-dependent pyruvate/acetoin dehydrogenase alpha subunit